MPIRPSCLIAYECISNYPKQRWLHVEVLQFNAVSDYVIDEHSCYLSLSALIQINAIFLCETGAVRGVWNLTGIRYIIAI